LKTLPTGLKESLDSGATTLCRCWKLIRADDVILGFTDHDEDLVFDGVTYRAASGFTASSIDQSLGLNVDGLEVQGALIDEALSEDGLAAGLFDNARITLFLVDWRETDDRIILFAGSIGEVSRGEVQFSAEIRGLAHALNQPRGRLYQRGCDAVLGDGRCGIDITGNQYHGNGTVIHVSDSRAFRASGLGSFTSGWFSRGRLEWATGANAGALMEVKVHDLVSGEAVIELWEPMAGEITTGDAFSVTAGCDKSWKTCQERFGNGVNFRGFPFLPGNDWVTSYPNRGEGNDGNKLSGQ
jgi:uncharacterized phage protein (TIGR02218 family)